MRHSLPLILLLATSPALASRGAGAELPPLPDTWSGAGTEAAPDSPWWSELGEPGLASLIDAAVADNYDLRAASDRIRQADALAQQALSALLPSLRFDYSFGGQNPSLAGARAFTPLDQFPDLSASGSGNITAALALDVFGRNTLGYQAGKSDALASIEDRSELTLVLAQRIASAWLDVALFGEQQRLLAQQQAANEQLLELVRLRFDRGEATATDVLQQEQQLASIESQIPLAASSRDIAARQLSVLTGRPPTSFPATLPEQLPTQPPAPELGTPRDLMGNRPDLRANDQRLTSAWRRRMQAERAFLPSIPASFSLSGVYGNTFPNFDESTADSPVDRLTNAYVPQPQRPSFPSFEEIAEDPTVVDDYFAAQSAGGFDSGNLFAVGSGSGYGWQVGVQISMPLFDFATISGLRQARAAESAAAHALAQAELAALQEVETARLQLEAQTLRAQALATQADAARSAFETSRERYARGIGQYLNVLTALVSKQAADLSLLQAQRNRLDADILLRDALGGAWTQGLGAAGGSR